MMTDEEKTALCAAFMGWHEITIGPFTSLVDEQNELIAFPASAWNPLARPADWAMLLTRLEELGIQHTYYFEPDLPLKHSLGIWDAEENKGISAGWYATKEQAIVTTIAAYQSAL